MWRTICVAMVCVIAVACKSPACPKPCVCDSYDGLNRANCSSHRLINAQIGMPALVEVLDLSDNSIAHLEADSFAGLRHIRSLLVASNYVQTIELQTFAAMPLLVNLSLANNRLEWFDSRIVEAAGQLLRLDLSGNKLMDAGAMPLLSSRSLQVLHLHRAQITFVAPQMLADLPALRELDLSDNLLITLHAVAFRPTRHLLLLDVVNNPFNCDANLRQTMAHLARRSVQVVSYDCAPTTPNLGSHKFERMQMPQSATSDSEVPTTAATATPDLLSIWHEIATETASIDCDQRPDLACNLLRSCRSQLDLVQPLPRPPDDRSRLASVKTALYAGILIGSVLGGCVVYVLMIIREGCAKSARRRQRRSDEPRLHRTYVIRDRDYDDDQRDAEEVQVIYPHIAAEESLQPVRTGTRRRAGRSHRRGPMSGPEPQRLGRRRTVYNWLFDRPAHRRYARAISQSTSNLVRRLSQSRLFLNAPASAASGGEPNQRRAADGTTPASGIAVAERYSVEGLVPPIEWIRPAAAATSGLDGNAAADSTNSMRRSETPPPLYGDIVK